MDKVIAIKSAPTDASIGDTLNIYTLAMSVIGTCFYEGTAALDATDEIYHLLSLENSVLNKIDSSLNPEILIAKSDTDRPISVGKYRLVDDKGFTAETNVGSYEAHTLSTKERPVKVVAESVPELIKNENVSVLTSQIHAGGIAKIEDIGDIEEEEFVISPQMAYLLDVDKHTKMSKHGIMNLLLDKGFIQTPVEYKVTINGHTMLLQSHDMISIQIGNVAGDEEMHKEVGIDDLIKMMHNVTDKQ